MPFAPEYVKCVLREDFDDAKALFVEPLLAIHRAHLVMLAELGILPAGDARTLRDGPDVVDPAPEATAQALLESQVVLDAGRAWLAETERSVSAAADESRRRSAAL